jgi:hypothetical protein
MMRCPECGNEQPFSIVKCDCGYVFPLAVRQKEERRLAHEEKATDPARRERRLARALRDVTAAERDERRRERADGRKPTAERYPALRVLAKVYRVFAALVFLLGVIRIVTHLSVLFSGSASVEAKAAASGFIVAIEVAVTGLAFISCYAVAELIRLLFELNDRAGRTAST